MPWQLQLQSHLQLWRPRAFSTFFPDQGHSVLSDCVTCDTHVWHKHIRFNQSLGCFSVFVFFFFLLSFSVFSFSSLLHRHFLLLHLLLLLIFIPHSHSQTHLHSHMSYSSHDHCSIHLTLLKFNFCKAKIFLLTSQQFTHSNYICYFSLLHQKE